MAPQEDVTYRCCHMFTTVACSRSWRTTTSYSAMRDRGCAIRTSPSLIGLPCCFVNHLYLLYAGFILSACSADTVVLVLLCLLFQQPQLCS